MHYLLSLCCEKGEVISHFYHLGLLLMCCLSVLLKYCGNSYEDSWILNLGICFNVFYTLMLTYLFINLVYIVISSEYIGSNNVILAICTSHSRNQSKYNLVGKNKSGFKYVTYPFINYHGWFDDYQWHIDWDVEYIALEPASQ